MRQNQGGVPWDYRKLSLHCSLIKNLFPESAEVPYAVVCTVWHYS